MSGIAIFSPNPDDVVYQLRNARWSYRQTGTRKDDVGFTKVSVFPLLFEYVVKQQQIPDLANVLSYLLQRRDKLTQKLSLRLAGEIKARKLEMTPQELYWSKVHNRAQKLILDFYRELHTFALLGKLGSVSYQKVLDLQYNVDFVVNLRHDLRGITGVDKVGIQSAMRKNWAEESFTRLKSQRRGRRGNLKDFQGPVYWLTNRERRYAVSVSGVWLFGENHIDDLEKDIVRKKAGSNQCSTMNGPNFFYGKSLAGTP